MTPIEELRQALSHAGRGIVFDTANRHRHEWPALWRAIDRLLAEDAERRDAISRHPSSLHPLNTMPPRLVTGIRPSPYKSSEDYR